MGLSAYDVMGSAFNRRERGVEEGPNVTVTGVTLKEMLRYRPVLILETIIA
jgi:hypothetical protein